MQGIFFSFLLNMAFSDLSTLLTVAVLNFLTAQKPPLPHRPQLISFHIDDVLPADASCPPPAVPRLLSAGSGRQCQGTLASCRAAHPPHTPGSSQGQGAPGERGSGGWKGQLSTQPTGPCGPLGPSRRAGGSLCTPTLPGPCSITPPSKHLL